jgi:hypothetical protein
LCPRATPIGDAAGGKVQSTPWSRGYPCLLCNAAASQDEVGASLPMRGKRFLRMELGNPEQKGCRVLDNSLYDHELEIRKKACICLYPVGGNGEKAPPADAGIGSSDGSIVRSLTDIFRHDCLPCLDIVKGYSGGVLLLLLLGTLCLFRYHGSRTTSASLVPELARRGWSHAVSSLVSCGRDAQEIAQPMAWRRLRRAKMR